MSTPEVGSARDRRRIRQHAQDGLSVAALSLSASVGVVGLLWVVLHWVA